MGTFTVSSASQRAAWANGWGRSHLPNPTFPAYCFSMPDLDMGLKSQSGTVKSSAKDIADAAIRYHGLPDFSRQSQITLQDYHSRYRASRAVKRRRLSPRMLRQSLREPSRLSETPLKQ